MPEHNNSTTFSDIIRTERLCLKSITDKDADGAIDILTSKDVAKTFILPEFKSREEAEKLFCIIMDRSYQKDRFVYGVYLGERIIGFINDVEMTESEIELGYVIHPNEKSKGYATEVLAASIKELLLAGYKKVKAGAFEDNPASMRVMEKCGMTRSYSDEDIEYRGEIRHCINYELKLQDENDENR